LRDLHEGNFKWSSDIVEAWNRKRDRRPQFATNRAGVQRILPDDPWPETDQGWVANLRDHLRLGTYIPKRLSKN